MSCFQIPNFKKKLPKENTQNVNLAGKNLQKISEFRQNQNRKRRQNVRIHMTDKTIASLYAVVTIKLDTNKLKNSS